MNNATIFDVAARSADIGVITDPDLHLLVGGIRMEPVMQGGVAVFYLRLPCPDLRLMSRTGRPLDLGINNDGRVLGYGVAALSLVQDGQRRAIALDHPDLDDGFHDIEPSGLRWTNGMADLPPQLFDGATGIAEFWVSGVALPQYRATTAAETTLFARFESLGDDCEFGLVQREYHAEPMSLLRWAGTDAARLVLGLCRGFEGLGDPATTTMAWNPDAPDYRLCDPRYLTMHTWLGARADDPAREEQIRLAGCARLRLLRRKLLADIAASRRIFVFKQSRPGASPGSFPAVHAALRGIGPAPLLCVTRAASPEMVGVVEARGDGLYIGHIDVFDLERISYGAWQRICAATAALVDGAPNDG